MSHAHRVLKAGGRLVVTVDLFLNVSPFCSRLSNEFGTNQNIKKLIDDRLWVLKIGECSCLAGFPEFSVDNILSNLENYLIGVKYPALAQCFVLEKR